MKLKKVIIDGKEYYQEVEDESSEVFIEEEPKEVKNKSEESNNFGKNENNTKEKNVDFSMIKDQVRDISSRILSGVQDMINTEKEAINFSRKSDRISKIIPFLSDDELHNLALKIANDEDKEVISRLDIEKVLPFFTEEDCDIIFIKKLECAEKGTDGSTYIKCAPFVSQKALSKFVDLYIEGEFKNISKLDTIYPFLAEEDIKKLFYYELGKDN